MHARPSRALACVAAGACLTASPAAAQQAVYYPPNAPGILYSEYSCAHVDATRASFDRELEGEWVCHQEQMSPGVRATFRANATHVRFDLEYFHAGFFCNNDFPIPLSWEFGLEVDGVRMPTGADNPLYPLQDGSTPWVSLGRGTHDVSLVWPNGADVDLRGLRLKNTSEGGPPVLQEPPARPASLLTVFGESITQGLNATHTFRTYPAELARTLEWSVENLGLGGRTTVPTDARLAAGFPVCTGVPRDQPSALLVLGLGSADFHTYNDSHVRPELFEQRYRAWLEEFRTLQPDVPVLCVTPIPRSDECSITSRSLEDYRARIRRVVAELGDGRIYLFEGRDLIPLPPLAYDPLFDADLEHLNDAGFRQYASRLARFNLVRNGSFELKPLADCIEIAEPDPYLWTRFGPGSSAVTENGIDGGRALSISSLGTCLQDVYGLDAGDAFTLVAMSRMTVEGNSGRIVLEFLDVAGRSVGAAVQLAQSATTWTRLVRSGTVPPGAARARLRLKKEQGNGELVVDELELTVAEL